MHSFKKIFLSGIIWKFLLYASSFLLNLAIAHYFGASISGPFFYLLTNISLIIVALGFGFDSAINFFNSKKEFSFSYLLSTGILSALLSTALFIFFVYCARHLELIVFKEKTFYIILYVFGILILGNVSALYYSSNNHVLPNVIPGLVNFLLLGYIILLFSLHSYVSIERLLTWYLISGAVAGLLLLGFALKSIRFKLSFSHSFNRIILVYSGQVFLANVLLNFFKADIWLINYFCSPSEMGNYLQTTKFSQLILLFPNLAAFSLFPLITQNADKKIESKVSKLVFIYFFIGCIFCTVIIFSGFWLFPFLYGSSFSKMYLTFLFYTPGILGLIASYPLTPYFAGINRNRVITVSAFYSIIIMFIADLFLIPYYSIFGAAIGSSLTFCFYFFRLYFSFKKIYPEKQRVLKIHDFYKRLTLLVNR